jgi:hypothetical protein
MVVFPREEPVIENLNSYYLDPSKLLEHYQGQLDSGVIHFKSAAGEGAVFFDKDGLLEGNYESKEENLFGKGAVERLINPAQADNYTVSVYQIPTEEIYFWTSLLGAKRVYEDLSTEFTDLEGLIRKMGSEKLSGYIEISLTSSGDGASIFFRNGRILGGSYSWSKGGLDRSRESRDSIIGMAKEKGAVFHVSRISSGRPENADKTVENPSQSILEPMEELLAASENLLHSVRSTNGDFRTLLKRKFLELAETYPFLDPFAGEFEYADHKIRFTSDAGEARLAEGILASLKRLADDKGIQRELKAMMDTWFKKHGRQLTALGVKP